MTGRRARRAKRVQGNMVTADRKEKEVKQNRKASSTQKPKRTSLKMVRRKRVAIAMVDGVEDRVYAAFIFAHFAMQL